MTTENTYLALAVQHALAERGMSQAEYAARLGTKPSDLSRRLAGEVSFTNEDVPRLAAGLGIEPADLIERASALGWQSTQAAVRARVQEIRNGSR